MSQVVPATVPGTVNIMTTKIRVTYYVVQCTVLIFIFCILSVFIVLIILFILCVVPVISCIILLCRGSIIIGGIDDWREDQEPPLL